MSTKAEKILALALNFEKNATDSLVAEAKKKEEKKLDPKAKVRNRGTVCVPAESAKDKKDHFPINNEAQARNALARVNQFSKVPDWYSGSLQSLVSLVAKKVKAKYPSIEVSKEAKKPGAKKAYLEKFDSLIGKMAQRRNWSNYGGEGISPAAMTAEQLAMRPQDLATLLREMQITPEQYRSAVNLVARQEYGPQVSTIWDTGGGVSINKSPGGSDYPSIPREVQLALNKLGFTGKDGRALSTDSTLGPNTQHALNAFKTKYPDTANLSTGLLYEAIKYRASNPDFDKQPPPNPYPSQNIATWGKPPEEASTPAEQIAQK